MQPLVSASWLQHNLEGVIVLDTRWSLAGSGRDAYNAGHIPGASFVDLDSDLADPPGPHRAGRHPLPSAERFAAMLSRVGYTPGRSVVAYDDMGGAIAARLWWLMGYFQLTGAAVLDGGLQAWQQLGGALVTDEPKPVAASPLVLAARSGSVVDADTVDALRRSPAALIVDSRALDRYRGDNEPIDPRAGHIPGAVHGAFANNLTAGHFKSTPELVARFTDLGAIASERVVFYCGSGVTACHNILALTLAGKSSELYEGSWSDWSGDASRPLATGDAPSDGPEGAP